MRISGETANLTYDSGERLFDGISRETQMGGSTMPALNWGLVQDGGVFESLMHAILYILDSDTILFGRLGTDAGQDARSADGTVVYQAKYRQNLNMNGAISLALEELEIIKKYRSPQHDNNVHWRNAQRWVLVANFLTNPYDEMKWKELVVPSFRQAGLEAEYWGIERLEQELHHHSEIEDVFFGGQNRVLVGLKEAHDLLSAVVLAACLWNYQWLTGSENWKRLRSSLALTKSVSSRSLVQAESAVTNPVRKPNLFGAGRMARTMGSAGNHGRFHSMV
jgi:hypothetical protein